MNFKPENYIDNSQSDPNLAVHRQGLLSILSQRATSQNVVSPGGQVPSPQENVDKITQTAETTEPTPLSAEMPPEQPRNTAETAPEYSAHFAETTPKCKSNESPLDHLPSETQEAILALFDQDLSLDAITLQVVSKPPYGMGIKTSRGSIYRFHHRHTTAQFLRDREEDALLTANALKAIENPEDFSQTAAHLIKVRLLETAIDHDAEPNHLLALSKTLERLRATEHAERRLQLLEQTCRAKLAIPS